MQPDVLAELAGHRPAAPPALRARVGAVAAAEPPRRRRPTWRAGVALLAAAVLAAAAAAAVVLEQRGSGGRPTVLHGSVAAPSVAAGSGATAKLAPAVPPARTRLQDYDATLSLRVRGTTAISSATKQAVRIARSFGGFAAAVNVDVAGGAGDATLRLRVPVAHVQDALERLSALGTITGESTHVQDVQAGVNAIDRELARLQRQLRALRAVPQTAATKRKLAALTAQVQRLQRQRANAVRTARLATISLQLTTRTPAPPPKPVHHGPLHGAVVALRLLGIGALYALVVGGPVVLLAAAAWLTARFLRRRGEQRLLSGSGR